MELVSGWADDDTVYLVERVGEALRYYRVPAKWSAFFTGMDEKDRLAMARSRDVVGLEHSNYYTRIDFKNRWARREAVRSIEQHIKENPIYEWERTPGDITPDPAIYEADVGPLRRLLSDNPRLNISTNPRLVWLDLEADSRCSFEQLTSGKGRVLVWSLYKLDGGQAVPVAEEVLEADSDEAERAFLGRLYQALEPFDVVLSWNGSGFDFPALEMRTNRLRVKVPGRGKPPLWNRWCWLDHMEVYKKYNQAHESGEERSSFALNAVAQHLLGEGKDDFNARYTWQAWAAGGEARTRLVRYCSKDTALMPRIEAKSGFVALHIAVCHVTRCFPDTHSLRATEQGDGFLLRLGAERGYRFPTKPWVKDGETPKGFAGAYVMEPRKLGAIDNVHVCDFAGLYPSIMRTWNMSLDTLIPLKRADAWKVPMCYLPDREYTKFRMDIRGIIPSALDQLVSQRAEYTKKADAAEPGSPEQDRYKRLSAAFKIVNNSMYGIVGSPYSRFYEPEIAEGVTQTGKWLIQHVAATAEKTGILHPIYGDTDSVFAQGEEEVFAEVVASLNAGWAEAVMGFGCPNSYIKLEFEKTFGRLLLKSAKCYAGKFSRYKGKPYAPEKKPEVRGLEYKRGDTLRLARQMQYELINKLLPPVLPQPPLPNVEEMRQWVAEWRARVLEGELRLEEVVLSKSIKALDEYAVRYTTAKCTNKVGTGKAKRSCGYQYIGGTAVVGDGSDERCPRCGTARKLASLPVHARVAKVLAERGEAITPGTRIEYLVVRGGENHEEDETKMSAVPAGDEGAIERIDRDYYWDKLVYPPTFRLLEVAYPQEEWADTAARRRKAKAKATSTEGEREVMGGLPLFATPANRFTEEVAPLSKRLENAPVEEAPPPPPPLHNPRTRRALAAPKLLDVVEERPVLLRVEVQGEETRENLLEAVRAAAQAYPGPAPLVVELHLLSVHATVRITTTLKIARGKTALAALERLVVPGSGVALVKG